MTQCSGWQSPGWSNPNLLINWDMRNPVNQRGQTSYTVGEIGTNYTVDMVKVFSCTVAVNDGYIKAVSSKDDEYKRIMWWFENLPIGTYTISMRLKVNDKSGMVYFRTSSNMGSIIPSNPRAELESGFDGILTCTFTTTEAKVAPAVEVLAQSFANCYFDIDIQAVKLEVGSISTLAIDLMQPSDYAAELRKCQRYLQIYNVPLWFYAPQEWYAETIFDLQEEMRIIPSFSFEGNVELTRDNGDLDILVSTVTQFSGNTTKPLLRLAIDNGKAVIGHSYLLRELKFIFSAEL